MTASASTAGGANNIGESVIGGARACHRDARVNENFVVAHCGIAHGPPDIRPSFGTTFRGHRGGCRPNTCTCVLPAGGSDLQVNGECLRQGGVDRALNIQQACTWSISCSTGPASSNTAGGCREVSPCRVVAYSLMCTHVACFVLVQNKPFPLFGTPVAECVADHAHHRQAEAMLHVLV